MTTQKQTAAARPELKSHPKTELNFAAGAASELANLAPIPGWAVSAAGDDSISGLAARLGDRRLQNAQRLIMAQQIGRAQGNRYLQRILALPGQPFSSLLAARSFSGSLLPAGPVQRMPVPVAPRTPLGRITIQSPGIVPTEGQLRYETEIVPPGSRPGRYAGYRNRIEAYADAWEQDTISAVGEDREGMFHTLRTDWPRSSPGTRVLIIPLENRQFPSLWWVNVPSERGRGAEQGPGTWRSRAQRANSWLSSLILRNIPPDYPSGCRHDPQHRRSLDELRDCLEAEYVELLAESLNISRDSIYVCRTPQDLDYDALINFDIQYSELGKGGITRLPTTRTGETPRPMVLVGPHAFTSESRLHVLSTAVHEAEHYSHAARSIELLERWRRSTSRQTFEQWLRTERRARRISETEYVLAMEEVQGGSSASQTLAYLEGFTTVYHRLPITQTAYRLGQLDQMADYWLRAGHQIEDDSIRRLAAYYRTLDAAHQTDFASHVREMQRRMSRMEYALFWNRVVRDVLGG